MIAIIHQLSKVFNRPIIDKLIMHSSHKSLILCLNFCPSPNRFALVPSEFVNILKGQMHVAFYITKGRVKCPFFTPCIERNMFL